MLARTLAITAVYLIVLVLFIGLFFIIIPELSSSISAFAQNLPGYLRDLDTAFRNFIEKYHLENYVGDMDSLYAMIDSAMEYAKTIAPEIANIGFKITMSALSGISDALLAFVVSAYLLASKEKFIAQVKRRLMRFSLKNLPAASSCFPGKPTIFSAVTFPANSCKASACFP